MAVTPLGGISDLWYSTQDEIGDSPMFRRCGYVRFQHIGNGKFQQIGKHLSQHIGKGLRYNRHEGGALNGISGQCYLFHRRGARIFDSTVRGFRRSRKLGSPLGPGVTPRIPYPYLPPIYRCADTKLFNSQLPTPHSPLSTYKLTWAVTPTAYCLP